MAMASSARAAEASLNQCRVNIVPSKTLYELLGRRAVVLLIRDR
jgi:hypothetical protein